MKTLKNEYGPAEGPLGFPQTDRQAKALDALLRALPKDDAFRYRKTVVEKAPTELSPGERADVSWISTEDPDRQGEVVVARGLDDSQFAMNPLVTLNHCYWAPPAGKSLWRKRVKDGPRQGIKAKTQYPGRPENWTDGKDWVPDVAFALVQADLLRGKSIGFLPVKVHAPTKDEKNKEGWENVELVIDEWLLLEYACVFLPAQQNAVVEHVSKSFSPEVLAAFNLAGGLARREENELAPRADIIHAAYSEAPSPPSSGERVGVRGDELAPREKGPVPYEETPTADRERSWDADAAIGRLRTWAGVAAAEPAASAWQKYARGFAYFTGTGDKLGDFKLPHHDVIDGKLTVVFKGVVAALAAVNGARGGVAWENADDKEKVYHHLARHYRQFGAEPPELIGERRGVSPTCGYVSVREIEKTVAKAMKRIDPAVLAARSMKEAIDRARGRV